MKNYWKNIYKREQSALNKFLLIIICINSYKLVWTETDNWFLIMIFSIMPSLVTNLIWDNKLIHYKFE